MSLTMQGIIEEIQTTVSAISGIKSAPDYLPDMPAAYPFVATYVDSGDWAATISGRKDFTAKFAVELHIDKANGLSKTVLQAMGYAESIPLAIINNTTFRNNLDLKSCEFTFGPLGYMGVDTVGFRWLFGFGQIGVS